MTPRHRPAGTPAGTYPEHAGRRTRWRAPLLAGDAGMSTAEYAIGTIAAAAFAAVLYAVVTGDAVLSGLTTLIEQALSGPL